jgi:hypothetical protein
MAIAKIKRRVMIDIIGINFFIRDDKSSIEEEVVKIYKSKVASSRYAGRGFVAGKDYSG